MRRTNIKGLSFDTIKLEGSVFTAEIVEKAAFGAAPKQEDIDYHVPRGLRLLDEIGRSFKIARALWENLEEEKKEDIIKLNRFYKEFFTDALSWSSDHFEKFVNINPAGSTSGRCGDITWYIDCNKEHLRLIRKSTSLARPSYLEFNIQTILKENRFSEYQMMYRIMHGSRIDGFDLTGECIWDIWKKQAKTMACVFGKGCEKA